MTTDHGLGSVASVAAALDAGADALAAVTRLRRDGLTTGQAQAALSAGVARRAARRDWHAPERLLLTPAALEQASRPVVSAWRARRFADAGRVLDLCAGIGGDTLALAEHHCQVLAIDHDMARLVLLAHNARVRNAPVVAIAGAVERLPLVPTGLVHVDPGRRPAGRRARRLADYEPSVTRVRSVLDGHASGVGIVVSPALDRDDPDLPADAEIEFVQHGSDLVEAVAWMGDLRTPGGRWRATLLPAGVSEAIGAPSLPVAPGPVGAWLIEVAPAAVRARMHDDLARRVGARRVATRLALLTTDDDPGDSPWWTRRRVEAVLAPRPRAIRAWLRTAPAMPIEIAVHGVARRPEELWRQLGRPPRGPSGRRLHLIRTDDGARAVATHLPA